MDTLDPTLAAATTRLALADLEDARDQLRRASHVDWVSDQAPTYRRELWEVLNATYAVEQAAREAAVAAQPLVAGAAP